MKKIFKTKDLTEFFPFTTILVYIFGYFIISGFLSGYNVTIDEFISINFLKAGLIFVIINVPILVILYLNFEEPTDDFLKAKKYFTTLFINIINYLFWISFFIIDFDHLAKWENVLFFGGFVFDSFLFLIATSYAFRKKSILLKFIFQVTIPTFILGYFGIKYHHLGFLYGIIIISSILFISILGLVADRKYSWGHFILYIIYFCFISYLFGIYIYGNLPSYLRGCVPNTTTIISKPSESDYLNKIGFTISSATYTATVKVLYISSDMYLINTNGKIYYISKDLFNGFLIDSKKVEE